MLWPTALQAEGDGYLLDFLEQGPVPYVSKGQLGHGQFGKVLRLAPAFGDGPEYAAKVFYDDDEARSEIERVEAIGDAPESPMVPARAFGDVVLMAKATVFTEVAPRIKSSADRIAWVTMLVEALAEGQDALVKLGYVYTDMKAANVGVTFDADGEIEDIVFLDYGGLCPLGAAKCTTNIVNLPPPVLAARGEWSMTPVTGRAYGRYMVSKMLDNQLLEKTDRCPGLMDVYFNAVDPAPKANHTHCHREPPRPHLPKSPDRKAGKYRSRSSPARPR